MKNTIHKIFTDCVDEEVHTEFNKFSRGVFENRYLLEGKRQPEKWSIKASAEFANYFVRRGLEGASGKIKMTGAIISTLDLSKDIDFEISDTKGYMGIKQNLINSEIDAKKIITLMNKYPKVFFALSFSSPGFELKIKAKAPKSGKPGSKGEEEPKADFCSLKTTNKAIVEDLFFDIKEFKELMIKHTLEIKEIELPKGEKDPVKMRENAKRKGIIKRLIILEGNKQMKEKAFVI